MKYNGIVVVAVVVVMQPDVIECCGCLHYDYIKITPRDDTTNNKQKIPLLLLLLQLTLVQQLQTVLP